MPQAIDALEVTIGLDASRFKRDLRELQGMSEAFGRSFGRALSGAVSDGRRLSDVMRSLLRDLSHTALAAALQPLGRGASGWLSSALGGIFANARGNVVSSGVLQPFAKGGVVTMPTLFPMARGTGLMGEAGPEAILPLARGPDGRLGVQATAGHAAPVAVTVNIHTPDAEGMRRSQGQVSAMLSRAVERGMRLR